MISRLTHQVPAHSLARSPSLTSVVAATLVCGLSFGYQAPAMAQPSPQLPSETLDVDRSGSPWVDRTRYDMPFANLAEWLEFMSRGGTFDTAPLAAAYSPEEFAAFVDGSYASNEVH